MYLNVSFADLRLSQVNCNQCLFQATSLNLFNQKIRWVLAIDPVYLQTKNFGSLHKAFVLTLTSGLQKKHDDVTVSLHYYSKLVQMYITNYSSRASKFLISIKSTVIDTWIICFFIHFRIWWTGYTRLINYLYNSLWLRISLMFVRWRAFSSFL